MAELLPVFRETPLEAVQTVVHDKVILAGRTFLLARPDQSDHLLDHPFVKKAFAVDEYMPYWVDLWPAARMLGKALLQESWPTGLRTLELGCGLGLAGVVGLACGLHVTFSDYDLTALQFAAKNAALNGQKNFELLPLDWRYPPANLSFPLVLGADLVYEIRNVEPLVKLLKQVLAPEGLCLLTDQDRGPAHLLKESLAATGFEYSTKVMHAGEPGGTRLRGTLYRIRHAVTQ